MPSEATSETGCAETGCANSEHDQQSADLSPQQADAANVSIQAIEPPTSAAAPAPETLCLTTPTHASRGAAELQPKAATASPQNDSSGNEHMQEATVLAHDSPSSPVSNAAANKAEDPVKARSDSPVVDCADGTAGFDADTAREAIAKILKYKERAKVAEQRLAEVLEVQQTLQAQLVEEVHCDSEGLPTLVHDKPLPLYNELGGIGYVYSSVYGVLPRIPQSNETLQSADDQELNNNPAVNDKQLMALRTLNSHARTAAHSGARFLSTDPPEAAAAARSLAAAAAGIKHGIAKRKRRSGGRAIPMLSALGSWEGLVNAMHVGTSKAPALLELEARYGHKWRAGSRSRWREVKVAWKEIQALAGVKDKDASPHSLERKYMAAAQRLDKERMTLGPGKTEMGFPTHLKKHIMPKYRHAGKD